MEFIAFDTAVARLSEPDADLNALRAELAVVLRGVAEGKFGSDPASQCKGLTLWTHPDDPSKLVRVRNHILTCVDGAQQSVSLLDLWIDRTSREEPRVEIPYGSVFPCQGKDFDFHAIQKGLEEIIGCPLTSSVKLGFDGFFHYVFRRQFKERDRQRLKAEQVVSFMQEWDVAYGSSYVRMHTGTIEVVCRLFPAEDREREKNRKGV